MRAFRGGVPCEPCDNEPPIAAGKVAGQAWQDAEGGGRNEVIAAPCSLLTKHAFSREKARTHERKGKARVHRRKAKGARDARLTRERRPSTARAD